MLVLIAGGGRTGMQLASLLLAQNHEIRMVEHRREILSRLHHELPTESIIEGEATDPGVLELANIGQAQVVAACTVEDADNLAICYLARKQYGVPRTIARINNPRNAWLFDEKFHVDVSINQAAIMAGMIEEEMAQGDMMTLLKLRRGQLALVEEILPPGSQILGKPLKDLSLPEASVIAAVIRGEEVLIPRGNMVFEVGDEVLAVVANDSLEALQKLFAPA